MQNLFNDKNEFDQSFLIKSIPFEVLSESIIARYTPGEYHFDSKDLKKINTLNLEINPGTFTGPPGVVAFPSVTVVQNNHDLLTRI